MSSQRVNLTTATPTQAGRISTIKLVSQSVTGPPGADGAGVSVALKESGTTKVAVATVADFQAGFDVSTAGEISLDLTEYVGGALPLTNGGTGATTAAGARTALELGTAALISSTAGGDLSGTLPSPTVAKINGVAVTGTPAVGYVPTATSTTAATWQALSGTVNLGRPAKSGTIYSTVPGWNYDTTTPFQYSAGTVYYFPWLIESSKTVSELCVEVTTAGAGSTTARLGIMSADTSWQPTAVVLDAGTVATDSTGIKAITGLSTALAAGRYLAAVWFSGSPLLRNVVGSPPITPLDFGSTSNLHAMLWRGSSSYGGTFPVTPVAWASVTMNANSYCPILARFS